MATTKNKRREFTKDNYVKAKDSKEYDALLFDFIEKEIVNSLDEENEIV